MFESFEKRKTSRAGAIAPIVVVAVAVGILLVMLQRRPQQQQPERDEGLRMLDGLAAGSSPEGSASAAAFPRLELPGMSLETPGRAPITGDYGTGGVQHTTIPEWGVTWQQGELPPRAVLDRLVDTMAGAIGRQQLSVARVAGSTDLTVAGAPARRFEIVTDRGYRIVVTFAQCGGRIVQLIAGGPANVSSINTRMVDSFRCTPDPKQDLDREVVVVDARRGWKRTKGTGKPMLVNAQEVLVRPTMLPSVDATPLETFVPLASRAAGFTIDSDRPEVIGGRKLWRGSVDSKPAAVMAWRCPGELRVAAIHIISVEGAPLDKGIDLALTGRCLKPGEAPPVYPLKSK